MTAGGRLDLLPIWGVFLATVVVILLAFECGFRVGPFRRRRSEQEDRPPVGEMVAATLALLAFMLGFTYRLATSRFEVQRNLVIEEANAIGTTSSRGGCFPSPLGRRSETMFLRASVRAHEWH
jgi:hypothetical protein